MNKAGAVAVFTVLLLVLPITVFAGGGGSSSGGSSSGGWGGLGSAIGGMMSSIGSAIGGMFGGNPSGVAGADPGLTGSFTSVGFPSNMTMTSPTSGYVGLQSVSYSASQDSFGYSGSSSGNGGGGNGGYAPGSFYPSNCNGNGSACSWTEYINGQPHQCDRTERGIQRCYVINTGTTNTPGTTSNGGSSSGSDSSSSGNGGASTPTVPTCTPLRICSSDKRRIINSCDSSDTYQTCTSYQYCDNATCKTYPVSFVSFTATVANGTTFPATGHLEATPKLVKQGTPTRLYWNVSHAKSCTLTRSDAGVLSTAFSSGTNGLSAPNITGQTIFTLHCLAYPGITPDHIDESVVVNVVPVYQEQ